MAAARSQGMARGRLASLADRLLDVVQSGSEEDFMDQLVQGDIFGFRTQELEDLAAAFPCCLVIMTCIYAICAIFSMGVFVWMLAGFVIDFGGECDTPLKTWVVVDGGVTFGNSVLFALVRWQRNSSLGSQRMSCVIRAEKGLIISSLVFDYVWLSVGLYWVLRAHTCQDTSPQLYLSTKFYVIGSLTFTSLLHLHVIVLRYILRVRGPLRTPRGAPRGTISSLPVVKFRADLPMFVSSSECCICLRSFADSNEEIRETNCRHPFHTECLDKWLKVNRTCPVCRELVQANTRATQTESVQAQPYGQQQETQV